ncbi:MAG: hypothetical protein IKK84_00085 [Clostridia bacterium]|nr:hypothetical protein [Clostridia bacterium]
MAERIKTIKDYINDREVIVVNPSILRKLEKTIEELEAYEDLCEEFNIK